MAYTGTGQVTYDQNGYVNTLAPTDYGSNPWTIDNVMPQLNQGAQNVAGMQTQYNAYANQSAPYGSTPQATSGAYPSYPNSMGLGSQTAFGQAPQGGPSLQVNAQNPGSSSSLTSAQPSTVSQGFNPWSLKGEALSR